MNAYSLGGVGQIRCCKDCTDRHLKCHSTCGTYKEEKQAAEERKQQEKIMREKRDAYYHLKRNY